MEVIFIVSLDIFYSFFIDIINIVAARRENENIVSIMDMRRRRDVL